MVPVLALSHHPSFLWEKVSLLIEYEPLKTPLFAGPPVPDAGQAVGVAGGMAGGVAEGVACDVDLALLQRLCLRQYVTLRTVLELSTSSIAFSTG